MSVAICSWSSTVSFPLEKKQEALMSVPARDDDVAEEVAAERPPGELFDIWTSIQARAEAKESKEREPYVHPLAKHSSSLMSQKSLETCTESLGSETGSDSRSSSSDDEDEDEFSVLFSGHRPMKRVVAQQHERKEQAASVNYHCSVGRRSPSRPFPPPLPSVSCRGGPCVQMRPHRRDGRLVVEAVAVPSQNYLHAERRGGRLLLSFIDTATAPKRNNAEQEDLQEEEEEEEVEVVDRGTVVEVNVSGGGGGSGAMKVHRSSIVINKFVSRTPRSSGHGEEDVVDGLTPASAPLRRSTTSATTAAAAAVAASSLGAFPADGGGGGGGRCSERKLLVLVTTSERRNREELLSDVKRCSQLRKPLFIWETCRIATSS